MPLGFLVTYGFYLLHQFLYFSVQRGLVGQALGWRGVMNCSLVGERNCGCSFIVGVLDRFKQRI